MDRRVIAAIVLMMAIAMLPSVIFKRPPRPVAVDSLAVAVPTETQAPTPPTLSGIPPQAPFAEAAAPVVEARTVPVTTPLARYLVSTRGARLVEVTLGTYPSLTPADQRVAAQILPKDDDLLGLQLVSGRDTLSLRDWDFTPSVDALAIAEDTPLVLTASRQGVEVELSYRFAAEDYLISVTGQIRGLGPNGGTLLVGLGRGLRNTEVDSTEHQRELAVVTKARSGTSKEGFGGLDKGVSTDLPGPFEWVAIKSKYFVLAAFALDSTAAVPEGRITGVRVRPVDERKKTVEAEVEAGLPITGAGDFRFSLYAGPMEYHRLRAIGHDFYDVNPYGWPGFRTVIRPVAVAARWLLVYSHETLGLAYGMVLVLFGVMVRIVLWPLNQKAMRSQMAMQAIQPLIQDVQKRHKEEPQKLQQETFKLYKEHKVNPLGGCWPMLLPMPVLLALFFVFQNTIELRGAPFVWLTDLSRPDPFYVIPVLMGVSMFAVSKLGQMGMPPNPQMKMMLYVMPVMMTVLFAGFASGLNLYYTIQNIASLPQQWMIAQERKKLVPPTPPAPVAQKGKSKR